MLSVEHERKYDLDQENKVYNRGEVRILAAFIFISPNSRLWFLKLKMAKCEIEI